jgi:hypothetical protein
VTVSMMFRAVTREPELLSWLLDVPGLPDEVSADARSSLGRV